MLSGCGIQFDEAALDRASISKISAPMRKQPICLTASQEESRSAADAMDVLEPIHGQSLLWWVLELVPLHYTWQDIKGIWHRHLRYVAHLHYIACS